MSKKHHREPIDQDFSNWFYIRKLKPHVFVIQERLDLIDPRFYTKYTNMYLVRGDHSALLFDTGSGITSLMPHISPLLEDRELIVICSHNHFDHIGGNYEFEETNIHRADFKKLMRSMDISFLQSSPSPLVKQYEKRNYKLEFAPVNNPLVGNEIFQLGTVDIEVISTPGHTPGSICLRTSKGEILTGDTFHSGAVYLPSDDQMSYYMSSINELIKISIEYDISSLYTGHETPELTLDDLIKFKDILETVVTADSGIFDDFLQARVQHIDPYVFIRPG